MGKMTCESNKLLNHVGTEMEDSGFISGCGVLILFAEHCAY